jgi:integrase
MGYIYKPKLKNGELGKFWWIQYYDHGKRVRETTENTKESVAKSILKSREGKVANGEPILPRQNRILYDELVKDLIAYYKTTGKRGIQEVEDRLAHLNLFFNKMRGVNITPALITEYVQKRQGETTHINVEKEGEEEPEKRATSNRTINIELAILRKALRLAYENGKLQRVPPIRGLKEASPREGFFEQEQYGAVRRALPEDLRAVVTIAYTFGWRIKSEVLPLQRRHLDLKARTLRLDPGSTKNGEGRIVYLTPELLGLLGEQLDRVDELGRKTGQIIPWLFPHLSGKHLGKPRTCFRKTWETACKKAGIPGRILHDFRRTAVRNMERSGVPRSVAMKLTGHKTESVYRRYAIVSDADLQEATLKLTATSTATSGNVQVDAARAKVQYIRSSGE